MRIPRFIKKIAWPWIFIETGHGLTAVAESLIKDVFQKVDTTAPLHAGVKICRTNPYIAIRNLSLNT